MAESYRCIDFSTLFLTNDTFLVCAESFDSFGVLGANSCLTATLSCSCTYLTAARWLLSTPRLLSNEAPVKIIVLTIHIYYDVLYCISDSYPGVPSLHYIGVFSPAANDVQSTLLHPSLPTI
jgi:hypothetical protein